MENKEVFPELFVLGAGPGDPELITVKGYKILQEADVILYDNLANKDLLDIAKPECEKVYVGKQPYGTFTTQETLHVMIKHFAFAKGKGISPATANPAEPLWPPPPYLVAIMVQSKSPLLRKDIFHCPSSHL